MPPISVSAGGAGPQSGRQDSRANGGYDGSGWNVTFAAPAPARAVYRPDAFGVPAMMALTSPQATGPAGVSINLVIGLAVCVVLFAMKR